MTSDTEIDLEIDERDHSHEILKRFGCSREKEMRCDLTIKVGVNELKVNRELMIVASYYVGAMFAHDTLEKQTGVVIMKDVEFEFVKKCVDFVYTGKISISLNKCEGLLYVACLMQLSTLREYIGLFLKKHLTVGSFFNIRRMAVKFTIENLQNFCNEFAYENMDFISDEKEFKELDADYVLSVLNVKKSASTGGEDIKVSSILKWIKFDAENRQELLVKMLNSVDLKNVSIGYSRNLVENEPLCYQSAACTRMFCLATMDSFGVKQQKMDSQPSQSPNAVVIFDTKSKVLQAYKPSSGTWTQMHNLRSDMVENSYTAVFVRRYLFVLMGNKQVFRLNIVDRDSKWIRARDMLQEHGTSITAASLKDFIYVGGKYSIERYNLRQDSWEMMDTKGISLNSYALVAHGDCVYSLGEGELGKDHSCVLKKVNKPLELAPVPPQVLESVPECGASIVPSLYDEYEVDSDEDEMGIYSDEDEMGIYSAVSYNGLIYVSSQSNKYHCYNPITNKWTRIKGAYYGYRKLQVAGGILYTVNGNQASHRYNVQSEQWINVDNLRNGQMQNRATVSVLLPE